tara:strand:- start:714 stop:1709 length:996 start_codon:yes stop_codon:yes gene_type:complete
MSTPSISLPKLDCPDVLLPTPADLSNLFGGLATHAYRYEIESLKTTLEQIEENILDIYNPKWEKIDIPEKKWDIMMTRLSAEYPMYVQQKILELINTIFPISFNVTILGIQIDILEFLSNPNSVLDNLKLEEIDSVYDLIPDEYKVWNKFETADFKKESVRNYLRSEVAKKMNLLLHGGFTGLIGMFDEIWDTLGLPTIPALETLDLEALIRDKTAEELEQLQIFGFKLKDLLGGDFDDNVEIPEFSKERLLKRAREFAEEWQTYLIKTWMQKVTSFFDAIGLGALTQWITFTFCDFLTIIGFPKTIALPDSVTTIVSTVESSLPNTTVTE